MIMISDFGKGFAPQPDVMATPYFGVGYHDWDRMVNAGENYSHAYAGGGLHEPFRSVS